MPPTEPYHGYAAVYDALGQCRWGATLADFVLDAVLPERGLAPRTALDLACGTGAAALVLARAGLRTVGLDRSAAMLRAARRKADSAGVTLRLVRADLRAFAFAEPFDLVLCCYDSLNYLVEPGDLTVAVTQVCHALARGGLFVCDLTTRHAYTGELDGIAHDLDLGDLVLHWHSTWDEASQVANTEISVNTRMRGQLAQWQERHTQRAYVATQMAQALHRAGLRLLATHGTANGGPPLPTPPEPNAPRVVYIATRVN